MSSGALTCTSTSRTKPERISSRPRRSIPTTGRAHHALGILYLGLKRPDDAIKAYERVQALAPDNTKAYNNLGSAYVQQERFDKATEMYQRSLSLDKNAIAYSNLGTALYEQGMYADAARSLESAVALPNATFELWFNLGADCYWAPDLRGRAKEAYATAIRLGEQGRALAKPESLQLVRLASAYAVLAMLTEDDEARQHRLKAGNLLGTIQPSHDVNVLSTLATTYEELGDRSKALDVLEQAIQAGYSTRRIEGSPWLEDLRADERYIRLRK